ncbi:MAG: L-threonate dehydrogenase [Pseudomonadota bacterium]
MTKNVAVFGLGSMGMGIAQSCLAAGLRVTGFDPNKHRTRAFAAIGGERGTPQASAPDIDAAVLVVLNAKQVEDVLFGAEGIVTHLRPGTLVMVCATVAPEFAAQTAARCIQDGLLYLDAPISGGAVKAGQGALSVMAAGSEAAFAAAGPILDATAEAVFHLGDTAGQGSAMKAANQLLAGVHIAAMAEALTFAMTQNITPETFLKVISQSAGASWMLENRAPHVVAGDYSPKSQVAIWPKDLGIVLGAAQAAGLETPLTRAALGQFDAAVAQDLSAQDDAAVAKVYARQAGLTLPGDGL